MEDPFKIQHGGAPISAGEELFDIDASMLRTQKGGGGTLKPPTDQRTTRIAILCIVGVFVVLLARAFSLQMVQGGSYRQTAEGNRTRTTVETARRGVLYDREGQQLVYNAPRFFLTFVPADLPREREERERLFLALSEETGIAATEMDLLIAERGMDLNQPVPLPIPLAYEIALSVYAQEGTWPGVSVVLSSVRQYASTPGMSLAHVLGYTGLMTQDEFAAHKADRYRFTDMIGKQGIEASFEPLLRGTHGTRTVEVDARGREIRLVEETLSVDGVNLHLTIDRDLTQFIEEQLLETFQRTQTKRASVVVLDPRDGSVRALVSLPGYDNNAFAEGISQERYTHLLEDPDHPLFPRAIAGAFPPGSTFKTVVASIALDRGVITPTTSFLSTGGIQVSSWFFPDWKAGGHGITDVRKAIAESVNTFFYAVGGGLGDFQGLGIEALADHARAYGIGQPTGINLPLEAPGFLPTKAWKEEVKGERWYIGDTYHAAIGQGDILVTPLQLAVATSVFANGGVRFQPRLVEEREEPDGTRHRESPNMLDDAVGSALAINTVRAGMRDAVLYGSARSLSTLPIAVAGKTGTAQVGNAGDFHAWFTSFGPYESPEIVVTVLVEEGGEGSAVATPIAREIYRWWAQNRSLAQNN